MKRFALLVWTIMTCAAFFCAGTAEEETVIDYDLSGFSRNMVYAQMVQVTRAPEEYEGKVFRVRGNFSYAETLGAASIIFTDRTGCCEVALYFRPEHALAYPDEYPPLYSDITITARLAVDPEKPDVPCLFIDAVIEQE